MPAPSIVVTLEDVNGDEWPVRLWGLVEDWNASTPEERLEWATAESERLAKTSERWNPALAVRITNVEAWNQ